jgi:DNA-binding MarR family transcriptional regulator
MSPTLTPQLIGQTEKTLNAILDRRLAESGLTEPQWVALTLAVMGKGEIGRDQLAAQVSAAAKFSTRDVQAYITELADAGLLEVSDRDRVTVSEKGTALHARIRAANVELTGRLWGDLAADELGTAARVLEIVLERANAELGHA